MGMKEKGPSKIMNQIKILLIQLVFEDILKGINILK